MQASNNEITNAYRRLAKVGRTCLKLPRLCCLLPAVCNTSDKPFTIVPQEWHPDRHRGDEGAKVVFQEILRAYQSERLCGHNA